MRIGVDIGGTNLVAGLVDDKFNLVDKVGTPANGSRSDREIIDDIIMLCKKLMAQNNLEVSDIEAIGLGVPGCFDNDNGVIVFCENINFLNTPVGEWIRREIDVPVYLGNDADCAALGEAYAGATKDAAHSVMVTIGTGIGGGIIINKKIYSGFNGCGGELGHMVIKSDGELCGCGRRGCFEAYGSATALVKQTKDAIVKNPESYLAKTPLEEVNGKTAFDAMRAGCPVGTAVVEKYVENFATGITNIINIFQPEMVVIGGGVSKEGKPFTDMIMKYVSKERYGENTGLPKTTLCTAVLGNDAGVIGAALLS
ncbi:MAG: ROK family protein [Clostridia bacterium]|nr:ROK family protein [Clostridia bacterium]